mgnify:FL=1
MSDTNMAPNQEQALAPEVRSEIDRWVAKYPPEWKQSAVMAALQAA